MKKLFAFIFIFVLLIINVPTDKAFSLLDYYNGEYVCYLNEPISNKSINLGACYMDSVVGAKENVQGESLTLNNFEPIDALRKLNAKVIKVENLEGGATILYAYSTKIPKSVIVEDEKVNLQIAHYDSHTVIGWPLILGSF